MCDLLLRLHGLHLPQCFQSTCVEYLFVCIVLITSLQSYSRDKIFNLLRFYTVFIQTTFTVEKLFYFLSEYNLYVQFSFSNVTFLDCWLWLVLSFKFACSCPLSYLHCCVLALEELYPVCHADITISYIPVDH